MNAAGNADLAKQTADRGTVYLQIALTLTVWIALSGTLLTTRALSRFGSANFRELYDIVALSSFIVFIGTLSATSLIKVRAKAAVALSSALLTASYYIRLFHIVSLGNGTVTLLPLVAIIRFDKAGSGSIAIDLGQLGLYTLLYFLFKSQRMRACFKKLSTSRSFL